MPARATSTDISRMPSSGTQTKRHVILHRAPKLREEKTRYQQLGFKLLDSSPFKIAGKHGETARHHDAASRAI